MNRAIGFLIPVVAAAALLASCDSGPKQTATEQPAKPSLDASLAADSTLPAPGEFVEIDGVAEMIYQQNPEYPRVCQQKKEQGTVWVKALVGKDGSVIDIFLYKSSGFELLDRSALDAGKGCRFRPATKDGKPVAIWVVFKYEFTMGE